MSDFAIALGINIPTGKDSLSMKQQYEDKEVFSPGTVIVSAVGEVTDFTKCVGPVIQNQQDTSIIYIDFSGSPFLLGGSSFAQSLAKLGSEVPTVNDAAYFVTCFETIQELIRQELILAGHDVSAGGLITCLLEMNFTNTTGGLNLNFDGLNESDLVKILFSEKPGIVLQIHNGSKAFELLDKASINYWTIGQTQNVRSVNFNFQGKDYQFEIDVLRDKWYKSSYLLDAKQHCEYLALERYLNYKNQALSYHLLSALNDKYFPASAIRKIKAAIIREKGVNGDREMAFSLWAAGFDVKDVHMTDLINGRETLEDVQMIVFVGGFSNSDVLGSAKGWAGAFLYNQQAKETLDRFYAREDTMSLGVCNGCQLMVELNLLNIRDEIKPRMLHNDSGKFESAFVTVDIQENKAIMLQGLENSRLGIWIAHGEGKFAFGSDNKADYHIPIQYVHTKYPGNPNGSMFNAAAVCSENGRHLAMMPHLERSVMTWQWPYLPEKSSKGRFSPWFNAFVNAKEWLEKQK